LLDIGGRGANGVFLYAVSPKEQLSADNRQGECRYRDYIRPTALARLCGGCFAIELCWVRRLAREDRDVASQWNLQMDWVIFPFALVILLESFSQTVGFNPHNRVLARIECVF
jgi:hypothetical protein